VTRLARLALAAALSALASLARADATFDHSAFDALLRARVVNGMVDYDAFKASREFRAYLDRLARFDPATLSEAERLAYWINVYNAYTIELINKHGERESIRNINKTAGLKLKGPWREELVVVGGRRYHLDNVEHDIIRKQFKEPRIHFALVCAAMSCPPLRSEAYVGARLDAQLTDQARKFLLESPSQNRVDTGARVVYVSMIFEYYKEDFGGSDGAIGRYIAQFHPEGLAKDLLLSGKSTLEKATYDWTLNSQEKARSSLKK
jgi:hypothetical protein